MRMPVGNLARVVEEYSNTVLLPAAAKQGGALPFLVGMAAGLIAKRAPDVVAQYAPLLGTLGVMDEQQRMDVELLHEEASKALAAHPITIAGYSPDQGDLDKLREIMNRYGEQA